MRLTFIHTLLVALGISLMLAGCSSNDGPDLGDWTLKTNELTLTENLRVSETDAFYFGGIADLDVTSHGRMVVADLEANNVKVLRPDGSLVDTVGGPGGGPGEFQSLSLVQVARGDSLYAHDFQRLRLTVFAPDTPYEPGRVVSFSLDQGGFVRYLYVLDEHFVGTISSPLQPQEGVVEQHEALRRIDEDGTLGDTLLLAESHSWALNYEDGSPRVAHIPFDRQTILALSPTERLYYGGTDSLHIEALASDGTSDVVASISADPIPVGEAERDSALADTDDALRSMVASAIPNTKPAFTDLVVADDGRLWVQRPKDGPSAETVAWWVLDPDTKTIQEVQLPTEVDLEVVRDGNAYGTTQTEMGAPAVVRYRIGSST